MKKKQSFKTVKCNKYHIKPLHTHKKENWIFLVWYRHKQENLNCYCHSFTKRDRDLFDDFDLAPRSTLWGVGYIEIITWKVIFTLELWCNRKNKTKQYKTKQSKKKKTSQRSEQVSSFLLHRISTVWYPISYILRFFSQWPTNFYDWKPLIALHCGVLSFLLLTEQTSYNLSSFRLEIRRK